MTTDTAEHTEPPEPTPWNLDCMPDDDLEDLLATLQDMPHVPWQVQLLLYEYARGTLLARRHRARGYLSLAYKAERLLERLYDRLPVAWQW